MLDLTSITVLDALCSRPAYKSTVCSSGVTVDGQQETNPVAGDAVRSPNTSCRINQLTSKRDIARCHRRVGLRASNFRFGNADDRIERTPSAQGAIGAFLYSARDGRAIRVSGGGSVLRDYVSTGDVARRTVALAEREDAAGLATLNVGSDVGHSRLEVLDIVRVVVDRELAVRFEAPRRFDARGIVLDVGHLAPLTGWRPTPLGAGIAGLWRAIERSTSIEAA